MNTKNTYGMNITKLKRHKEVTGLQKIENFFRRNKTKAFRGYEIEKIFQGKLTRYIIRNSIRKLYARHILDKKQFMSNKTYYFWNEKKEKESDKKWKMKNLLGKKAFQ